MNNNSLRILIVAGEASGDLHGSHLVESLQKLRPEGRFFGMGGKKMRALGVETFFDIERMGAVGVVEVLEPSFQSGNGPRLQGVTPRFESSQPAAPGCEGS